MRTYDQLITEIQYRKENNLPRIELTAEERARSFGDVKLANRDRNSRIQEMIYRFKNGLKLSKSDTKEVKKYLKD